VETWPLTLIDLGVATPPNTSGPKHPIGIGRKSMVKIPQHVLQNCAGLAIFNVIRAGGFQNSLAAGSGVVVARRPDGTWSPPSAFIVSTLGAGFMLGLDIHECVCVLNTPAQVAAFTHPRVSLGGEAAVAIGPVGAGRSVEAALSKTAKPVWSYMKSRGLWAGIQVDGTIIVSRPDANAAFHAKSGITAKDILQGDVSWPAGGRNLFQVLMAVDGRGVVDETIIRDAELPPSPPNDKSHPAIHPPPVYAEDEKVDPAVEDAEYESALDEKKRLEASGY
jgi:SH3 domain-containing YSC84-like protein 1